MALLGAPGITGRLRGRLKDGNMDMDAGRIVKSGFIVVMAAVIGYFVYAKWDFWSGRTYDPSLAWAGPMIRRAKDAAPDDPKKVVEYLAANSEGKLTIDQITINGAVTEMSFRWEPETRQNGPVVIPNPIRAGRNGAAAAALAAPAPQVSEQALENIPDAVQRFWLKNILLNRNGPGSVGSLVALATLDDDQKAQEVALRKSFATQLSLLEDGAKDGTSDRPLYKKVLADIEAAKNNPDPPEKSTTKANQVSAVLKDSQAYLAKIDRLRIAEAKKYIDQVQKIMHDDQKEKVNAFVNRQIEAEIAQQAQQPGANVNTTRANRGNGGNGNNANNPANGNNNANPNRGNRGNPATPATPPAQPTTPADQAIPLMI